MLINQICRSRSLALRLALQGLGRHHLVLFDVLATSLSQTRCNVIRTYDIIDRLNGDPEWKPKVRVCVRYNFPQ